MAAEAASTATMEQVARAQPAAHDVAYRPEIDGLRGVAVCSVVLYHGGVPLFNGGYVGVDIFFVISGYLISSIIWGDLGKGRFSFLSFYERRARRIFPALFVVLAASSLGALILFTPQQLDDFGKSMIATTGFVANFYFCARVGYFNHDTQNSALIHLWSLAVEEQFYLLFPILLIVLARVRILGRNPVLLAAMLLSLAWCLYREATHPSGNFFATPARAWELLAGALVAANRERWLALAGRDRARVLGIGVESIGAVLVIGSIFAVSAVTPWPGKATIPVVLGTALVILAARDDSPVGRVLGLKPMTAIGLISYSAYLWHQPLFAFAHAKIVGALPPALLIGLIGATFAFAWLSWRYVETPFRSRTKVGRRALLTFALAMPLLFVTLGGLLHLAHGFPQRYSPETLAIAAAIKLSPHRVGCHTEGLKFHKPANGCRYYGQKVTWAVLGDSHGIEIGEALAEDLKASNQGILHLTFSGCQAALTFVSDNPGCSNWTREAVAYLRSQPQITSVLVAYRTSFHLFGDQLTTYPALPAEHPNFLKTADAADARRVYWSSFRQIVRDLSKAGKHVVIVRPVPELPADISRYVYGRGNGRDTAGSTTAFYRARNRWINARLDKLRGIPGIAFVDPASALCDTAQCWAIVGGKALYSDDNHLDMAGARRVVSVAHVKGQLP